MLPRPRASAQPRLTRARVQIRDNIALGNPSAAHDDARVLAAARLAEADGFVEKLPEGFDSFLERPVWDEYAPESEGSKLANGVEVDYTALRAAAGIKKSSFDGSELSGGQMQRLAV